MPTIRRGAPVLLALWPYLMLAAALLPEETAAAAAELWWLLTPAVLLANLWNACTLGDPGRSVRTCLWVKLVHIPFYLLLFAAGAVMVLAMVVPAFTLLTPLLLLMLAGMEWVLLAVGSSYGIAGPWGCGGPVSSPGRGRRCGVCCCSALSAMCSPPSRCGGRPGGPGCRSSPLKRIRKSSGAAGAFFRLM